MKLFAKRAFALKDGDGREHLTAPLQFKEVPDSCKNDMTFISAVKSGDITVVEGQASKIESEAHTENETAKKAAKAAKAAKA